MNKKKLKKKKKKYGNAKMWRKGIKISIWEI